MDGGAALGMGVAGRNRKMTRHRFKCIEGHTEGKEFAN
jgi:hypothetical protein